MFRWRSPEGRSLRGAIVPVAPRSTTESFSSSTSFTIAVRRNADGNAEKIRINENLLRLWGEDCYAEKEGGGRRRKDTGKLIEGTAGCVSVRRILCVSGFEGNIPAPGADSAPSHPTKQK